MSTEERVAELTDRVAELERRVEHLLAHAEGVPPLPRAQADAADDVPAEVQRLIAEGRIIHAVKAYHRLTGADLVTAKARVDELTARS
jgi:hypothetical protein